MNQNVRLSFGFWRYTLHRTILLNVAVIVTLVGDAWDSVIYFKTTDTLQNCLPCLLLMQRIEERQYSYLK